MDKQHYHGHLIHSGAELDRTVNEWTPTLIVLWEEGADLKRREILFKKTFPTEQAAQECAYQFAVSWIEGGKPELPRGT
jgi:hypothetical protein